MQRSVKKGRYFGGLAILYKDELKPGIKLADAIGTMDFRWTTQCAFASATTQTALG
jgi:hypothetical protein